MSKEILIELINVTKEYSGKKGRVTAIRDLNLKISKGEFIIIGGPSGAGKTTLLNLIAGLDRPTQGEILLFRRNIRDLNEEELAKIRQEKIGIIFQFFNLIDNLTVLENVMTPLIPLKIPEEEIVARAEELLSELGLIGKKNRFPRELSGGEQQRVAIVRALITDPEIIIADEPIAQLDEKAGKIVIDLLLSAKKRGKTVILATASQSLADSLKKNADKILWLERGKVINKSEKKSK